MRRNPWFQWIRVTPTQELGKVSHSMEHFRKWRRPGLEKGDSLTCFFFKVLEKLLIEDESHTTNFFHLGLRRAVSVYEVGGDCDGQLPTEFFSPEPCVRKGEEVGLSSGFGVKTEKDYLESYSQMPHGSAKTEFWISRDQGQAARLRFAPKEETHHQRLF